MENRPLLEPITDIEKFPLAPELPEGCIPITLEDDPGLGVRYTPQVVYSHRAGLDLHLEILSPFTWNAPDADYPLLVYVPGSAWHKQETLGSLGGMMNVAREGIAVAIVEYCPSENAPFPAQMEDTKIAIRFMKEHAKEYHVDASKIGLWGDSSGGHTVLMTGITGSDFFPIDGYAELAPAVKCIVDWYGPVDVSTMNCDPSMMDHHGAESPEGYLIGRVPVLEHPELVAPTVPTNYISEESAIPPILIMHGSRDVLVPFRQSCDLYEVLKKNGKEVTFYKLEGGDHGWRGFASKAAQKIVIDFLKKHLA